MKSEVVDQKFDAEEILKRPYTRLIVPDDDGSYRGEILEFPGCIATGETGEDALRALHEVALSWLESTLAIGRAIPEPAHKADYSGKLVLRLPKSLHRKAAMAADRDGSSLNTFIVTSIAEQIGGKTIGKPSQSAQVITFANTFVFATREQETLKLANTLRPIEWRTAGTSTEKPTLTRFGNYGN